MYYSDESRYISWGCNFACGYFQRQAPAATSLIWAQAKTQIVIKVA